MKYQLPIPCCYPQCKSRSRYIGWDVSSKGEANGGRDGLHLAMSGKEIDGKDEKTKWENRRAFTERFSNVLHCLRRPTVGKFLYRYGVAADRQVHDEQCASIHRLEVVQGSNCHCVLLWGFRKVVPTSPRQILGRRHVFPRNDRHTSHRSRCRSVLRSRMEWANYWMASTSRYPEVGCWNSRSPRRTMSGDLQI